jgi:hypothetical protein
MVTKRMSSATARTRVINPVCKVSLMILLIIKSVDLNPVLRVDCLPVLLGNLWINETHETEIEGDGDDDIDEKRGRVPKNDRLVDCKRFCVNFAGGEHYSTPNCTTYLR